MFTTASSLLRVDLLILINSFTRLFGTSPLRLLLVVEALDRNLEGGQLLRFALFPRGGDCIQFVDELEHGRQLRSESMVTEGNALPLI